MNDALAIHSAVIRKAFFGDAQSKKILMSIAQNYSDGNRQTEAMLIFKEVAAAYRVGEFRASAQMEDALKKQEALSSEIQLLEYWIQTHPQGFCALPRTVVDLFWLDPSERVKVWQSDEQCICAIRLLERELTEIGEHFFSPGGTVERRAVTLLQQYFGLEAMDDAHVLTIHRVRIALDTLADKIIERIMS